MPHVQVINETQLPLHISLRQISPLHYQNSVHPGEKADFHCGRVWFTIEARIDRGGDNDASYSKFETFAAPVAVTLTVLSLGAGAVYVAAAGGASAAFASVSARVGAAAATHAPTARRLYKYARKGQRVVQIGQVLGIGGGAIAGKRLAEKEIHEVAQDGVSQPHTGVSSKAQGQTETKPQGLLSGLLDWDEKKRVKEAKKVLKGLLEGSVVSSAGWYMGGDRVIRIKGGPRATQLEGILVIETDTLEDFVVVGDDAPASAIHEEAGLSQSKKWFGSLRKQKKDETMTEEPDKDQHTAQNEVEADPTSPTGSTSAIDQQHLNDAMEANSLKSPSSSHTPSSVSSRASAESLYSRMKRSRAERADRMATLAAKPVAGGSKQQLKRSSRTTADAEREAEESADEVVGESFAPTRVAPSPLPPPDDDESNPPSTERVLKEMGFTEEQIDRAVRATGRPGDSGLVAKEAEASRKGDTEGAEQARSEREAATEAALLWLFENADRQVPYVEEGRAAMGQLAPSTAGSSRPTTAGSTHPNTEASNGATDSPRVEKASTGRPPLASPSAIAVARTDHSEGTLPSAPTTKSSTSVAKPHVVGAEVVTRPHWTSKVQQLAESSGASKLIKEGTDMLTKKSHQWLAAGEPDKTTSEVAKTSPSPQAASTATSSKK